MNAEIREFIQKLVKFIFAPPAAFSGKDEKGAKCWFNSQKQLHRKTGPAMITVDGRKVWLLYGKPFRLWGPTMIEEKKGVKLWLDEDSRPHRVGGAAVDLGDGQKFFFSHGKVTGIGAIDVKHRGNLEVTTYRDDRKEWKRDGKLHREDGPAVEGANKSINLEWKEWWIDGKRHRVDGPAVEYSDDKSSVYSDGKTAEYSMGRKEWWLNGECHREGYPAVIYTNGSEKWLRHGKLHRDDGPAKTTPFRENVPSGFWGQKKWFIDGKLHREDGPAVEMAAGTKKWYRYGFLHRIDGPAVEDTKGNKEWWVNGVPHREDGPAIDRVSGKQWFCEGRLHRENGPAIERRYGTSTEEISREWYRRGKRHREDGPAVEIGAVPESQLQRAKASYEKIGPCNDHGTHQRFSYHYIREFPSRERYFGDREWWVKSKLHREDGPAIERLDGTKKWYRWGRLHREDGPAVEYPKGSKEWWLKGKLHRKDGPAVEVADGQTVWNLYNPDWDSTSQWRGYNALRRTQAEEWLAQPPKWGKGHQSHQGKEWWIKGTQLTEEEFRVAQEKRFKPEQGV